MNVKLTPEVTAAHRNLSDLCEKFEVSVDEFCASPPQSLRTQDFYESECVPIAVECKDALSKFQSAYSDYENEIAEADEVLHQQKHRFEENAAKRRKNYDIAVAEADETLHQQKRRFEENAAKRRKNYDIAVAEADETLHQQKSDLEFKANQKIQDIENEVRQVGMHITLTVGKTTINATSKIPYNRALERVNRVDADTAGCLAFLIAFMKWFLILGGIVFFGHRAGEVVGRHPTFMQVIQPVWETALLFVGIPWIVLVLYGQWERNRKPRALKALRAAALAERDIIWEEVEKAVADALASRDQKVKDAQDRKEREDKDVAEAEANTIADALASRDQKVKDAQDRKERENKDAAEAEANTIAERDKKVNDARSRKDSALAYIVQEYQAFDTRLCWCLDKLQSFVDTSATENTADLLDEIQFQNLNEDGEQVAPHLTRIGNVSVWELSGMKEVSEHRNTDRNKARFWGTEANTSEKIKKTSAMSIVN